MFFLYNRFLMYARNESLSLLSETGLEGAFESHLLGFIHTLIRT